jgi:hypothetical protein
MANLFASPYAYYLELLGEWPTNLGLASQWLTYFDFGSVNCLQGTLQSQLLNRESSLGYNGWALNNNVTKYLLDGRLQYSVDNLTGCVFARQVNLPSDGVEAGNVGLDYGGFQAPATVSNRDKYKKLSVVFLETNASFLDLIIRPWIVLVGYNGLVARSSNSSKAVKANFADVVMLAKTGVSNRMQPRKIYRFYNLAPVSIEGEEYSYMQEGMKYSTVSFVYDGYTVLDANTPQLYSLNNSFLSQLGFTS